MPLPGSPQWSALILGASLAAGALSCGSGSPPGSHASLTLDGNEVNVIPPGTAGLQYTPDEHMTYRKQPDGTYRLWASGGGAYGTYMFQSADLLTLGAPTQVFLPAGAGTTAFDADYAGPGSILPAANGQDLLMIYHAENHLFGGVDYPGTPFLCGHRPGAFLGRRPHLAAPGPDPLRPGSPAGHTGRHGRRGPDPRGHSERRLSLCDVQGGGSPEQRQRHGPRARPRGQRRSARELAEDHQGSFSTPGLGGAFTPLDLVLDPSAPSDMRQPCLTYNTALGEFLLVMVGNGGLYWLASTDLITWSTGTVLLPAPVPDATVATTAGVHNWYPTLLSPDQASDQVTDQSGYLCYAKFPGDGTSHHALYRQGFTAAR